MQWQSLQSRQMLTYTVVETVCIVLLILFCTVEKTSCRLLLSIWTHTDSLLIVSFCPWCRTPLVGSLMPPRRLWERCLIYSCGLVCSRLRRSTTKPLVGPTWQGISSHGWSRWWSCMEGSPNTPLTHATEAGHTQLRKKQNGCRFVFCFCFLGVGGGAWRFEKIRASCIATVQIKEKKVIKQNIMYITRVEEWARCAGWLSAPKWHWLSPYLLIGFAIFTLDPVGPGFSQAPY